MAQVLNRDLTIVMLNTLKPRLYLDGFSATGIRTIRANLETGTRSIAVERSYNTFLIMKKNLEENNVNAEAYMEPFEAVVSKYRFDFIDVDPYGSVVPFVDIALNYCVNNGYIGFTATDLSVLTGSLEAKNMRRYGSYLPNNAMRHEMGLRNLIGFIARRAVSLDMGITPEISFWHGHYYRAIIRVKHGASAANSTLNSVGQIGFEHIDPLLGNTSYGPVWTGKMNNIFQRMKLSIPTSVSQTSKDFVESIADEDISPLFLDVTESLSRRKINLPSVSKIISSGEGRGIRVRRTHFSPTGLKSDNYPLLLSLLTEQSCI